MQNEWFEGTEDEIREQEIISGLFSGLYSGSLIYREWKKMSDCT